jgi:hypothetical protein
LYFLAGNRCEKEKPRQKNEFDITVYWAKNISIENMSNSKQHWMASGRRRGWAACGGPMMEGEVA